MKNEIFTSKKFVSRFARLTGATTEILENCSASCRQIFDYLGMTLIFTALLSATLIAYSVSTYSFKNMAMFPVVFIAWAIFIYLFDRLVIVSNSAVTKWVRTLAILVLALFHSFIWDTLTLRDDILSQVRTEYNAQVSAVNSKYDHKIASTQHEIDNVRLKNDAINKTKRSYIDSLQAEGRGLGKSKYGIASVYNHVQELKDEYKSMADSEIAANNVIIADNKKGIKAIEKAQSQEVNQIVKPGEAGLMQQIKKMHQLVFIQGTITEKIFFMIWFGLFCFLESLPVLAKIVFKNRMQEYFHGQDAEQHNSELAFDMRKQNDWTVVQSDLQFDLQIRLSQVASNSFLKKVEYDKQSIKTRLKLLEEFLYDLEKIEAKLKKDFPDQYAEFIKPEMDKGRNDFAKSINLNSNH